MKSKLAAVVPLAGGLAALKVYDALRKPKPLGVHYLVHDQATFSGIDRCS
jgi:hypothetical protein